MIGIGMGKDDTLCVGYGGFGWTTEFSGRKFFEFAGISNPTNCGACTEPISARGAGFRGTLN